MFEKILSIGHPRSPLLFEGEASAEELSKITQKYLCASQSACGTCPGCKKFLKGYHPDWVAVQHDSSMEDIRKSLSLLRQKPMEAAFKVFSISNLGESNFHMQNALLKTLEEPSVNWVILISARSRWTLLETVRSRCLILKIPSESKTELSEAERKIFMLSENADEINLLPVIEPWLKERSKTKVLFRNLLSEASRLRYPGHWFFLASPMESALSDLARNLHPKTVWDHVWTQSHS